MHENHLTYFKVENFKRFDALELTDIGQFNLVVGDNNVGKTSVLEALLFDIESVKCLSNFHKTLFSKGLNISPTVVFGPKGEVVENIFPEENFLKYIVTDIKCPLLFFSKNGISDNESIHISMTTEPESDEYEHYYTFTGKSPDNRYLLFSYFFTVSVPDGFDEETGQSWGGEEDVDNKVIQGLYAHLNGQSYHLSNYEIPLLYTSIASAKLLSESYYKEVGISRNKKVDLIGALKFLLRGIEDVEVRKINGIDHLLLGFEGKDELMPISLFGESVTRATQILLEIAKYKGKRLMIDEIDTGIHYSRLRHFLKVIFQVAEKNDVQLFMTTHSLECQQAFVEVFKETEMEQYQSKARQFSLLENTDGKISASVRNFEQLEHALDSGFDTRGGNKVW